jgi:O-antigen/teichoic acid export membrane protein
MHTEEARGRLYRLLRWSEKYTKTDMVYLAHGGFWSSLAQLSTSIASFALAIVMSRYVPKEAYGTYKYIFSFVGILSAFSLSGLGTAVLQSAATGHDGAMRQGFRENLRWSILIFLGALGGAAYYFATDNSAVAFGILVAGCTAPFLTCANLAGSFLAGKKDFRRQALYFGLWGSGIPIISLIVTALLTDNPLWFVAVYSLTNVSSSLYFYARTARIYRLEKGDTDAGMLSYAKHLSLIGILGGIAGNIDQILIFHYVGAAELAIYNFATAILDQLQGPLKTLGFMFQARFARQSSENIKSSMHNKMLLLFIFITVVILAYIPLAPFIYRVFFPGYVEAIPFSQIYALSLFSTFFIPASAYLVAKRKIREQYIFNIGSYMLTIIIMFFGVVGWGLWGLIWARVIIRMGNGLLGYGVYLRASRIENP